MITNFERFYVDLRDIPYSGLVRKITEILNVHQGKGNAITGDMMCREIEEDWGQSVDVRTLRKVIADMRLHGYPLGSCGKGYYLLIEKEETRKVIRSLCDRADALMGIIRAMANMYEERFGEELII